MKRLVLWVATAAIAAVVAPWAIAAKPTIERIEVNEVGVVDEFLSEACGVTVTIDAVGHIIVRTFDDRGKGLVELRTLNIKLTARVGDNTYQLHDVGADLVRVTPDGTTILMIIGQVPGGFTGVLKINLDTGEVILEPQHSLEGDIEEACEVLTA